MLKLSSIFDEIDQLLKCKNIDAALSNLLNLQNRFGTEFPYFLENCQLRLPKVLIAGPARTATTWLRGVLSKHPDIQVAQGEPNALFDISRGQITSILSWYARPEIWKGLPKFQPIYCDKSPSYICLSDLDISIIAALFPDMKILFGVRDNNDRLWSVIHHRMRDFDFRGTWIDFCREHQDEIAHHLNAGRVEYHVRRWRTFFEQSNILTIPFCEVIKSPHAVIETVTAFIGSRRLSELSDIEKIKINRRIIEAESKILIGAPPDDLISVIHSIVKI